jgi:flagellar biosynthesis protein
MMPLRHHIGAGLTLTSETRGYKRSGGDGSGDAVAVALRYHPPREDAPRVVAKGRGQIAEQILEIARQSGITIHEDRDLAALLEAVELDVEIPLEVFVAVAEILAYVYRANGGVPPGVERAARDEQP